uniref:FCP1 homology domain-containing protein n=1 Tax=Rhabditophanes sp. KR3021 TaxID=114890 RepID=A0AC35U4D2_9BILA
DFSFSSLVYITFFIFYFISNTERYYTQYQVIRYEPVIDCSAVLLQRLLHVPRKVMVLDLDETLIHSYLDNNSRMAPKPNCPPDFILKVTIDRHPVRFSVHLRPHVDYFLSIISQWYDLVIFTASMEIYGSAVSDRLDKGRGYFIRKYYRQHCTVDYHGYTKDLSAIHDDLSSVFILDNSPTAYRHFKNNAIPIRSWFNDPKDTCLLDLLPFLDALRFTADVRSILSRNMHLPPIQ